mmetsp:Transcript_8276/g.30521  ORF Transcript_8276/g.30521 Transcript_8276/m.30521 type:complete len:359 (+) Transcript_8276:2906-3982(+)
MLGRRATSSSFKQATALKQRHYRKHLRGSAQFDNWKEICQVVAKNVPSYGDGVLAGTSVGHGCLDGVHWCHDGDVKASRVVVLEVLFHLLDQYRVVRSIWVQPEDGLGARGPCTCNCQPNPVGDRCRLRLAHTPDVALVHLVLEDHFVAGAVHDLHHTFALDLECLVVAAVLLCLLRHEAHVADVAHGGNVEAAVRLAIGNAGLVHTRVAPIWDQALHVLKFTLFVPHLARVAHDAWHRGVDNDVGGNVQVGDAARGIHHGQARSLLVAGLQIGLDGFPFSVGQSLELCIERGQAMVGVHAQACKCSGVLLEGALEKHRHHVPEDDRVGHLHHGGLEMQGHHEILLLSLRQLLLDILP